MRVNLQSGLLNLPANNIVQMLTRLLAEHGVLQGVIRHVSSSSVFVFLQAKEMEIELPLPSQGYSLVPGQFVELTKQDGTIFLKVLPDHVIEAELGQDFIMPRQLEQVLVELNIPPTDEAVLVAQGLVERGFPVQESLVWSLLPWAEVEQLEEAFLALQAKYPLKPEILTLIRQFRGRDGEAPILIGARDEAPPDLQELLAEPNLEGRARWSDKFSEGELFKSLARLLVEERLVESLSAQSEYILALPFFRDRDLYASWVRIKEEDSSESDNREEKGVRVELQIPTATFGMVGAELRVQGRTVALTLSVHEHAERLEVALDALGQELVKEGWHPRELQVRRWEDAESSRLTL